MNPGDMTSKWLFDTILCLDVCKTNWEPQCYICSIHFLGHSGLISRWNGKIADVDQQTQLQDWDFRGFFIMTDDHQLSIIFIQKNNWHIVFLPGWYNWSMSILWVTSTSSTLTWKLQGANLRTMVRVSGSVWFMVIPPLGTPCVGYTWPLSRVSTVNMFDPDTCVNDMYTIYIYIYLYTHTHKLQPLRVSVILWSADTDHEPMNFWGSSSLGHNFEKTAGNVQIPQTVWPHWRGSYGNS